MTAVGRIRNLLRQARRQSAGLRIAFLRQSLHVRMPGHSAGRLIRALADASPAPYLAELAVGRLPEQLAAAEAKYRREAPGWASGTITPAEGAVLYALVRILRPSVIVETGTANGVSSAYLLAALARNRLGKLISIDLPFVADGDGIAPLVAGSSIATWASSPIPSGRDPGWMIPDELRDRWEIRLGDARDLLPRTLEEVGPVGLFFHDSLHSREHMLFEFATAWPQLANGAVLAADDVFTEGHDALLAFATSVGARWRTFGSLGFVRKSPG